MKRILAILRAVVRGLVLAFATTTKTKGASPKVIGAALAAIGAPWAAQVVGLDSGLALAVLTPAAVALVAWAMPPGDVVLAPTLPAAPVQASDSSLPMAARRHLAENR